MGEEHELQGRRERVNEYYIEIKTFCAKDRIIKLLFCN